MPQIGPMEILVVAVFALVVLGPNRIPEAARQAGKALAEFRRWSAGLQDEVRSHLVLDDTAHHDDRV